MTFEQSLDRLEEIVNELEVGELDLEQALALFEEGIVHLRGANSTLQRADARVQQLTETADGSFALSELDE
jgi:exodeoxyribonuclease VII small subunit